MHTRPFFRLVIHKSASVFKVGPDVRPFPPAENFSEPAHEPPRLMAPKKAITKKTAKRKAVTEVPAPAKKAAAAAGGKNEVVIEACKS